MIKQLLVLSLLFVLSPLKSSDVLAAKEGEFRMAVVDFQKALNGVEEGKKFVAQLKKEAEKSQKNVQKKEAEIQALQKELEDFQTKAQSGLLKPEAMEDARKKQVEYQTKMEAFFKLRQESGQAIAEKEQSRRIEMLKKMRGIVDEMGRKEGYSMVLERNESGLIYAATFTDLTEKLIQNYNKKFK